MHTDRLVGQFARTQSLPAAMALALLPALAAVALGLLAAYGLRPLARWRLRRFPGPRPAWLLGNLVEIVSKGKHEAYAAWARQYGTAFRVFEGGVSTVVVSDPEAAQ